MPTVKTIKPAGGGDYTTLQAWEDWADGEATADQEAECYTGDVGAITFAGWTATPTLSLHPKIYVASGNRHDGTSTPSGAKIVTSGNAININGFPYVEISGLFIDWTDNTFDGNCIATGSASASPIVSILEKLAIKRTTGSRSNTGIRCTYNGFNIANVVTLTVRNCVYYGGSTFVWVSSDRDQSKTITVNLHNNTAQAAAQPDHGFRFPADPSHTATLNMANNAFYGFTPCFSTSNIDTSSGGYNASSDATADDLLPTGAIINRVAATDFVSPNTSAQIPVGGGLAATGTDTSAFDVTDDIIGTARGSTYDIGAYQVTVVTITRGMPFGTRGTTFNGGRIFRGIIR